MYCEASHYLQIIKGGDGQMTQDDSARNHETIFPPENKEIFEDGFAGIFKDAKRGLRDALDLILIHNEHEVRGKQPRSTLNPLTLLLSIAAWERFISDCGSLLESLTRENSNSKIKYFAGPGLRSTPQGSAYLAHDRKTTVPRSVDTLRNLTDGRLPGGFRIRGFMSWTGKYPTNPVVYRGLEVAEPLGEAIRYRNGVAHRALPQLPAISDAENSTTIQAGYARAVFALTMQLINQSSIIISETNGFRSIHRLDSEWFHGHPSLLRGYENPGTLWPKDLFEETSNLA